ncbi:MAG: 3'-5' exonuclease [Verrucomicrobiales bacterium]|nr:3'-5' exonuclease [Verrucomicrobiales bacterium]
MAKVIPSQIPSKASKGEQRMHSLLGRLPDNCIAYYEPSVAGRFPDFVVVCPKLGMLVIEVKGWYARNITKADDQYVVVSRDGYESREKHPVRQAKDYVNRLLDEIKSPRFAAHLTHREGGYRGKPIFPIARFAVLSNISDKKLDESRPGSSTLRDVFPEKENASQDDLSHWETLEPEQLLDVFTAYFDPFWPIETMDETMVKAVCGLIHPEFLLDPLVTDDSLVNIPASERVREDNELLQLLDHRQQDFAICLGDGHRILQGVAGSGKTLILIARARALAERLPGSKLLLVCYNRTLAAWIRAHLHSCEEIEVTHFHQWAYRRISSYQRSLNDRELGEFLLSELQQGEGGGEYDAVFIDEAQDFEPGWFSCLLAAVKDPENGDFVIAGDGAQGLYERSGIRWKHLGVRAQGRTVSTRFELHKNYRNPREILSLAGKFLVGDSGAESESDDPPGIDDSIFSLRVQPGDCIRAIGTSPVFRQCRDREAELQMSSRIVRELLQGKWQGHSIAPLLPHEIGILYPRADTAEQKKLLARFAEGISNFGIPTLWVNDPDHRYYRDRIIDPAVKLQTIHSSKGLQYRAVIIVWADMLPHYSARQDHDRFRQDRRLLYVGMTRSTSFLAITASKHSNFTTEIEEYLGADNDTRSVAISA